MSEAALFSATLSEPAMTDLAGKLAGLLRAGDCVALYGDLGAGKSSFARAVIKTLAGVDGAPSPTFTLVQGYETPKGPLWHFDLYRLKKPEEVYELGWEEALAGGLVLVEWPEQAEALLPASRLAARLDFAQTGEERRILIEGHAAWASRLSSLLPQSKT